jgi:hypothetical protein
MAIIIVGVFALVLVVVIVNFFSMTPNDFIEKTLTRFLWLWLPFHALNRLVKECKKKYIK